MVDRIQQFIATPTQPPLSGWWMPWLVNVAAVPFVLVVGAILGEVGLRATGVLNDKGRTQAIAGERLPG
jgi:hypothetical protein